MRPLSIFNADRQVYWKAETLTDSQQSPKSLRHWFSYLKVKSASKRAFHTHALGFRHSDDMG